MCQSKIEGGRRCAAHTRPAFHAAITAFTSAPTRAERAIAWASNIQAAAEHAATPSGGKEVAALSLSAVLKSDHHLAGFLASAQHMAKQINENCAAVEADIACLLDRAS